MNISPVKECDRWYSNKGATGMDRNEIGTVDKNISCVCSTDTCQGGVGPTTFKLC